MKIYNTEEFEEGDFKSFLYAFNGVYSIEINKNNKNVLEGRQI